MDLKLSNMNSQQPACSVCNEVFDDEEKMVNSNGQLYHENCFVYDIYNIINFGVFLYIFCLFLRLFIFVSTF